MKIYYTGATTYNAAQNDKDLSLGGFKSSTPVPNDLISNLFGDISMYSLDEKLRETRAIIIHNDDSVDLTNLYIWFDKITDALGKFEVAAVALTPNQAGEVYMESIGNIRSTPYTGTFVQADTVANKQLLAASFTSNSYLGLWIRRVLEDSDKNQFDCDTLYTAYEANPSGPPQVTSGGVDITLQWT